MKWVNGISKCLEVFCFCILSVIRQKGESQNVCFKKTKHAKFSAKSKHILPLACFFFLRPPFWDSAFCLITDDFYQVLLQQNNLGFKFFWLLCDAWKSFWGAPFSFLSGIVSKLFYCEYPWCAYIPNRNSGQTLIVSVCPT